MLPILPSKKKFTEDAKKGKLYPLYLELPFIPPQQAYGAIRGPYSFFLESIKGPEKIARYSFAGADPFLIFKVKNGIVELEDRDVQTPAGNRVRQSGYGEAQGRTASVQPLAKLQSLLAPYRMEGGELPPFPGGAVGLISYDFVHYLERLPKTAVDDLRIPDAHFLVVDTVIAFDHKYRKTFLMSCPGIREKWHKEPVEDNYGTYYDNAKERIIRMHEKIAASAAMAEMSPKIIRPAVIRHDTGKDYYVDIVKRAKEYIKAGDIFQANLSQRVSAEIGDIDRWEIYRILGRINPSPFAAYMDMGDYQIVSSSPERLLRVDGGAVETRPIAGTRPRGIDTRGDIEMRANLLLNEKERAEHLMLIDLERNDLGKISDYGSVHVDEFMITEDYSHVIHIVSNIKGRLAKNKNCFDAIKAAFPGGTITGVPKVRCMEIIDELETTARGPYTGSLGYISYTGNMDLNIIIRTFVIKNGIAYVQAGAGIVADSEPEREYFETLKKAEALIKTLEMLR